jgi:hypothetical protein
MDCAVAAQATFPFDGVVGSRSFRREAVDPRALSALLQDARFRPAESVGSSPKERSLPVFEDRLEQPFAFP